MIKFKTQQVKKLSNLLNNNNVDIKYCTSTFTLFINGNKTTASSWKNMPYTNEILDILGCDIKTIIPYLITFCQGNNLTFDSKSEKMAEKLKEKQAKEEAKAAEKQAKIEMKERKNTAIEEPDDEVLNSLHRAGYIGWNESFNDWRDNLTFKKVLVETNIGLTVAAKDKTPLDKAENYEAYFKYSDKYAGKLKYNEWARIQTFDDAYIDEVILRGFYSDIENEIGLSNRSKVDDAYYRVCDSNKFNPLLDYLKDMANKWDGTERMETLFIDKLKVKDTELNRIMTKTWLLGAVKRAFQPGCKNEIMLILVGCQGDGKNTVFEKLFERWGYESNIDISKEQDYGMKLDRSWCIIVDEMADFDKKEAGTYKKWLSIRQDNFRLPFEHKVLPHVRHNCYAGSTNYKYFLKDYTDFLERRYYPLLCNGTREESWDMIESLTEEFIDQIWAETAYIYFQNTNVPIAIRGEFDNQLEEIQRQFKVSNEDNIWETLKDYLDRPYYLDNNGQFESIYDCINQLKNNVKDIKPGYTLQYINKIPSHYVKEICKKVIGDVRKHDYFKYNLKGTWEVNVQDFELNTTVYKRSEYKYYDGACSLTDTNTNIGLPF